MWDNLEAEPLSRFFFVEDSESQLASISDDALNACEHKSAVGIELLLHWLREET